MMPIKIDVRSERVMPCGQNDKKRYVPGDDGSDGEWVGGVYVLCVADLNGRLGVGDGGEIHQYSHYPHARHP